MRGEDKLVDGRELKREEEIKRTEDDSLTKSWRGSVRYELGDEQELAELPARVTTQHEDRDHRGLVLSAMRGILEGHKIVVPLLQLPPRELQALEALQTAVRAKDAQIGQFVFATDRRDLLEQALGVLQPTLLIGDPGVYEMGGDLDAVRIGVAELRTALIEKEDAQDELTVDADLLILRKPPADGDADADADADLDAAADAVAAVTALTGGSEPAAEPRKRSALGHEDDA